MQSTEFDLELFRRGNYARHFENKVKQAYDKGLIKIPIYLSLGSEFNSAALSMVCTGWNIFAQHRCHATYLNFGGDPKQLRDELLGLSSGVCGGYAGSNAIHFPAIKMWGHSGLMGEQVPISVGYAFASNEPTVCIMGDASCEEDYIYPSLGWAATKKLPILFIVEDNDLSILTKKEVRRNWSIVNIAHGLNIPAFEMYNDPWQIITAIRDIDRQLPYLINIKTCREVWHAGTGSDSEPEWNQYQRILNRLSHSSLSVDESNKALVEELWNEVLPPTP